MRRIVVAGAGAIGASIADLSPYRLERFAGDTTFPEGVIV